MSTNNKVFQVLVPSGNKAVAAAGTTLDNLTVGQIGVFDNDTKLAIDGTTISAIDKIFIAVGRGNDNIDDSAGQNIPLDLLEAVTFKQATKAVNQKQLISGFDNVKPDTDYTLRMEFRNGQIAQTQGTVGFFKSFSFRTGTSETGLAKDFIKKFYEAVKADETRGGLYKVTVVNPTTLAEITDIDAAAANAKFGLLIESLPVAETVYGGSINPVYFKNRQTLINLSLVENLKEAGAIIVEKQASVQPEGLGYDLRQQEYLAMGWKGHIYRASCVTGLELPGAMYYTNPATNYDVFHLTYENKGYAGWSSYKHPIQTIIAVPDADSTTSTSLKTVLDRIAGAINIEVITEENTAPTAE